MFYEPYKDETDQSTVIWTGLKMCRITDQVLFKYYNVVN